VDQRSQKVLDKQRVITPLRESTIYRASQFTPRALLIGLTLLLSACASTPPHGSTNSSGMPSGDETRLTVHEQHATETVMSMTSHGVHGNPHWRWTSKKPVNPEDQRKAEKIVQTLREVLTPYQDYRVAMKNGYQPFLHNVPGINFHFLSRWRATKEFFRFDPAEPTALLYRKTADGWVLKGVMYTASKWASEEGLNARIPLSVTQWHAHVNICLPPRFTSGAADWTLYGPQGSIVTEEDCDAAHGEWVPQRFGWMVHVFPFEDSPERIWAP